MTHGKPFESLWALRHIIFSKKSDNKALTVYRNLFSVTPYLTGGEFMSSSLHTLNVREIALCTALSGVV